MCVHDNVCCHTSHMTLFPNSESAYYGVHNIITMLSGAHNEKRERERREEYDTTTHLIKIQILPMLVVLASVIYVHVDV